MDQLKGHVRCSSAVAFNPFSNLYAAFLSCLAEVISLAYVVLYFYELR